jgi:serine/threonine-protein kinase
VSVAIQHINSLPLSPRDINPDIPAALEEITLRAMAPDMEKRYRSADAMLADLEEFRKNPSITFDYKSSDFLVSDEPDEPTRVLPVTPLPRPQSEPPARKKTKKHRGDPPRRGHDPGGCSGKRTRAGEESGHDRRRGGHSDIPRGVSYFLWTFFFSTFFVTTESYEVPQLKGHLLSEVMSNPEYTDKFEIIERNTIVSDEYDAGTIVDQYPTAGSTRKQGGRIQVDVSSGAKSSTMIDVLNLEYRYAISELKNNDINYTTEYENSDTVTKNHVIRTDPEKGTILKTDDTVKLVISLGPDVKMAT